MLYHGSYVSTELCRIADGNEELLIGVNDVTCAKSFNLDYEVFPRKIKKPMAPKFIQWIRKQLDLGHIVIAGFYLKDNRNDYDEDQEYNHICPIVGYKFDQENLIHFYFNDLWKQKVSLTEHSFQSRKLFLMEKEPEQPFEYAIPESESFGIAIKGFKGMQGCYRCKLDVIDLFFEPDWGAEDKLKEDPVEFFGNLSIIDLTPGKTYLIKCFGKVKQISQPVEDAVATKEVKFTAESVNTVIRVGPMKSDKSYFYRVVDFRDRNEL